MVGVVPTPATSTGRRPRPEGGVVGPTIIIKKSNNNAAVNISPFFLHNVVRLAGRPRFSDSYYTTSDDVNDGNNESWIIVMR